MIVLGDVLTTTPELLAQLLLCLLTHSPEQQAAALAASFAKAARSDVGRTKSTHQAVLRLWYMVLWYMVPAALLDMARHGEPSPALRQLAGLLAGVLCDVGPALCSHADFSYQQCAAFICLSLTALLASHCTDAARAAWRAQLLSLEPFRVLVASLAGDGAFPSRLAAIATCGVAAAVPEELRAAALQASRARGKLVMGRLRMQWPFTVA